MSEIQSDFALGIFAHCRSGFERDCADELTVAAAHVCPEARVIADCTVAGRVLLQFDPPEAAHQAIESIPFWKLAFSRQWFVAVQKIAGLPKDQRVEALMDALRKLDSPVSRLAVETLDTDSTRPLLRLCRGIEAHLQRDLAQCELIGDNALGRRLHVCFTATDEAYLGFSPLGNSHPAAMGIPRLRFPKGAPSRSALKLEEALTTLLLPSERRRWLRPGMNAVDLGAAPGGWTWVLVQNGLSVTAVDNGALAPTVAASPQVRHLRTDGLRYRPPQAVDWLVCDIVEKPQLVAEAVARWGEAGWCRNAVVNLKLPMKSRYAVVAKLLSPLTRFCESDRWAAKQLYHDRDEITCFLRFER